MGAEAAEQRGRGQADARRGADDEDLFVGQIHAGLTRRLGDGLRGRREEGSHNSINGKQREGAPVGRVGGHLGLWRAGRLSKRRILAAFRGAAGMVPWRGNGHRFGRLRNAVTLPVS